MKENYTKITLEDGRVLSCAMYRTLFMVDGLPAGSVVAYLPSGDPDLPPSACVILSFPDGSNPDIGHDLNGLLSSSNGYYIDYINLAPISGQGICMSNVDILGIPKGSEWIVSDRLFTSKDRSIVIKRKKETERFFADV